MIGTVNRFMVLVDNFLKEKNSKGLKLKSDGEEYLSFDFLCLNVEEKGVLSYFTNCFQLSNSQCADQKIKEVK